MNYNEFRRLSLEEQNNIMNLYEFYKVDKLKWLKERVYSNNPVYEVKEEDIINLSLNDFLESGELKQCDRCGYWNLSDDLIDTEGMYNGGVGMLCDTCRGNM